MSLNWQNEAEHERNEFFEPVNWSRVEKREDVWSGEMKKKNRFNNTPTSNGSKCKAHAWVKWREEKSPTKKNAHKHRVK